MFRKTKIRKFKVFSKIIINLSIIKFTKKNLFLSSRYKNRNTGHVPHILAYVSMNLEPLLPLPTLSLNGLYSFCLCRTSHPQSAPYRHCSFSLLPAPHHLHYLPKPGEDCFKGVSHTYFLLSNPTAAWCGCCLAQPCPACLPRGLPASIPASFNSPSRMT